MAFKYLSVDEAMMQPGLRMVVVGGVPSPWGEAAKGLLHLKGIDWIAVRLDYQSDALKTWAGSHGGPIAIYENERPRDGWAAILLLAERLAPTPSLLPSDPTERALAFGLAHEICGEEGLAWTRRLQLVHAGLNDAGGFAPRPAKYLARKYGHTPAAGDASGARIAQLLNILTTRLKAQRAAGSAYLIGKTLSAVDVYSATAMALFAPLPEVQCAMDSSSRNAFETLDAATAAALDPILLEHRDMMYARHLALPLSL